MRNIKRVHAIVLPTMKCNQTHCLNNLDYGCMNHEDDITPHDIMCTKRVSADVESI